MADKKCHKHVPIFKSDNKWKMGNLCLLVVTIIFLVPVVVDAQSSDESANTAKSVLSNDNNKSNDNKIENSFFSNWFNFGSPNTEKEKIVTTTDGPALAEELKSSVIDIDNGLEETTVSATSARSTVRQKRRTVSDDEDYDSSGDLLEGSGEVGVDGTSAITVATTPSTSSGQPRFYRVGLTLHEPYHAEYQDRSSPKFASLYKSLTEGLTNLYQDLPGGKSITLISVQPSSDPFFYKVTVDIGLQNYSDSQVIKGKLNRSLANDRRLGSLMASDKDFTFREFGEGHSLPNCKPGELPCRSGECLPPSTRCNNLIDCQDGSDEVGCSFNETGEEKFLTGGETVEFVTTVPGGVPVPIPDPIDRCRADDKVRCEDNSSYICVDQECDGVKDCNDGSDEKNCPSGDCGEDEFMCDVTRCIQKTNVCDGIPDCEDATDEQNCSGRCNEDEFGCVTGQCIKHFERCNSIQDCPGGEDEIGCPCSDEEFACHSKDLCIDIKRKCDGIPDCRDRSDEADCPPTPKECSSDEFRCSDGTCISSRQRCDGRRDCPRDDSDERNCRGTVCQLSEFTCSDGSCIPQHQHCDGKHDCRDKSDELFCPCQTGEFQCANGYCIDDSQRCDKYNNCQDGSDEANCTHLCNVSEFLCPDGLTCVPVSAKCDRKLDCPDGFDEDDCPACQLGEFRCDDGRCLNIARRCNGIPECSTGEDERGCSQRCTGSEYPCNDGACISFNRRCDGQKDCRDGSDEVNCEHTRCTSVEFQCKSDGRCISLFKMCDGRQDCPDNSDESACPARTCNTFEFTCSDGTCIDSRRRCDRRQDCPDGSDEKQCVTGCRSGEFQCRTSQDCLPEYFKCNGRRECRDGSDEENCQPTTTRPPPPRSCASNQFACYSGDECVPLSAKCNGVNDCRDLSDETNCAGPAGVLNLRTFPKEQTIQESQEVVFQCRDESLLRARVHWLRGDGFPLPSDTRQRDGRLEIPNIQINHTGTYICEALNYPPSTPGYRASVYLKVEPFIQQPTRPPTACKINEATCANGECIDKRLVCDGKYDCADSSDEYRCGHDGCEPNQFHCHNKKCVSKSWLCDSDNDCGDNSDEEYCGRSEPGSQCRSNEFTCKSGVQCVPRSFLCDQSIDCQDGSDEIGCAPPRIDKPPPPLITLDCLPRSAPVAIVRSSLIITCTAYGWPTPEISWRRNWKHVPSKCNMTSSSGVGTLVCPDVEESDQGAYSCEAISNLGSIIAVPDAILICRDRPQAVCDRGTFNIEAVSPEQCIRCFCFGKTTECDSADLFIHHIPPPISIYHIIGVKVDRGTISEVRREVRWREDSSSWKRVNNGFQIYSRSQNERLNFRDNILPYFAMPEYYHGNRLKSYGGYLKYTLHYGGNGRPINAPDIIIMGNNVVLTHTTPQHFPEREQEVTVRFWPGSWFIRNVPASREDIMQVLADVTNILIRAQYVDGEILDTTVTNIKMDSADIANSGLGKAAFVEKCKCPVGYAGLSCEECAPGYDRPSGQGRWRGECFPAESTPCPPGTYGDPKRNIPCRVCPCPLTNPSNQFANTCFLDTDGLPTCHCPKEYVGRNCERCAAGYSGNPNRPGDDCRASLCNSDGSLSLVPDPNTGACHCKEYATGTYCNQCKANTFYLHPSNPNGCTPCFCSGITDDCYSSQWYRQQVSAAFIRDTQGFKLVEASQIDRAIDSGIHINTNSREIVYQDFSRREPDIYHWLLPSKFLGNKVNSYGGLLNYTVRYVPTPGGQSSRNNAPDVQLISSNDIKLLYFHRDEVIEANKPQTITVPLREQYWQRLDGQVATREYFIMALADLSAILIKATYTTNTREAGLIRVSLDIAEERNTGQQRAFEVEQCRCPPGYRGLSCEDCDVGYTRTDDGLYLGTCELCEDEDCNPCNCNGHSEECDIDNGRCLNCRDGTTGETCNECRPGYHGDPYNKEGCTISGCECDNRGSIRLDCPNGQCICKANVEGPSCDKCRPTTFGLSENNVEGCSECFCSGITRDCQQSNLYRTEIPMQILNSNQNHGFTLTDSSRRSTIQSGFTLNEQQNEIGYFVPRSRQENLFWSLPPSFTGNKVTSYGGELRLTQRYTTSSTAIPTPDTDVILYGNGIKLFWTNPSPLQPNVPNSYNVPLNHQGWRRQDVSGPYPASRSDFLTVLANLEHILILATPAANTEATYLSDVSLDTAVEQLTGLELAVDVEMCRCPVGYRGTSCEACASGYYRDLHEITSPSPLGVCKRCPCTNNEESCSLGSEGYVICQCRPGFSGRSCELVANRSELKIMITPTRVTNVPAGHMKTFSCEFESSEEMTIKFRLKSDPVSLSQSMVTVQTLEEQFDPKEEEQVARPMFGGSKKITITILPTLKLVECVILNKEQMEVGTITAMIDNTGPQPTPSPGPRPHPPPPSISISISEPTIQIVQAGSTVRFRCVANSIGPIERNVTLEWSKDGGELPPGRSIGDRQGTLVITSVQASDSGTYTCRASNGIAIVSEKAVLTVGGNAPVAPTVQIRPSLLEVREGEEVELTCEATGIPAPSLHWTRSDGGLLNINRTFVGGVFRIANSRRTDEGMYVCSGKNPSGEDTATAQLIIREGSGYPGQKIRLSVTPTEYTGPGGDHVRFDCQAPAGYILRWSRDGRELPVTAAQRDGVLTIYNVSPADSGVYVCTANDPYTGLTDEITARVIVLSNRVPPIVRVEPERQTVSQGSPVELRCLASGDPTPTITWSKSSEELGSNYRLAGEILHIPSVLVRDRGVYICTAESSSGRSEAAGVVEVTRREPPSIELYPEANQIVNEGNSALLQCRVIGGIPNPKLRWTKQDGRNLTTNVEVLPNGVLRFQHVTLNESGGYICHAENEVSTVTAIANIEVHTRPVVRVSPPGPINLVEGQRVRLTCTATGIPQPTVSWERHTNQPYGIFDSSRRNRIRESALFEITSVTKDDEGSYTCTARNSAGTQQETIQLLVDEDNNIGPTRGDISNPSEHTLNPTPGQVDEERYNVFLGGRAELRCRVHGVTSGVYLDWIRSDQRPLPENSVVSQGTLYIDPVQEDYAGEYSCIGKSPTGSTLFVARAELVVLVPLRIKLHPIRQVVRPGDSAHILCLATGDEPITIEWSAVNRSLPRTVTTDGGYLHFRDISVDDTGKYLCKAINRHGSAEAVAEVDVMETPTYRPTVQAVDRRQSTYPGSSVQLRCIVPPDASGRLQQITWSKDGGSLPPNAIVRGEVLQLVNVQYSEQGRYYCGITTPEGQSRDYIDLRVEHNPGPCSRQQFQCNTGECISLEYKCNGIQDCSDWSDEIYCRRSRGVPVLNLRVEPSLTKVRKGDDLEVSCYASGENANAANITWGKVKDRMAENVEIYRNILRVTNVQSRNGGLYKCEARLPTQTYEEFYTLAIQDDRLNNPSPVVETKTVLYGKTVEIECKTDLSPPIQYSWHKQGSALSKDSYVRHSVLTIEDVKSHDAGTYMCTAENKDAKVDVPTILVVTGVVPYFAQAPTSYIILPTLPDSSLRFDFEISFKPESQDGLILYNGQSRSGAGDYVSLGLNGGVVEFMFDVGSGAANIRSNRPLALGQWHTAKVTRNLRDGTLIVDGEGPFTGQASGSFQGLDLVEPLYLGGVPDYNSINRLIGQSRGLVGCISRLVIGGVEHNLVEDASLSHDVTTCETCAESPCRNKGVCQEANTEQGYTCLCPPGFSGPTCNTVGESCYPGACGTGRCLNQHNGYRCLCPFGSVGTRCEKEVKILVPSFAEDSFIAYPSLKPLKKLKFAVKINPNIIKDGVVLYSGQNNDGEGDFISLSIKNRRVEFRFDSGNDEPVILRSNQDLRPNEWVSVTVNRDLRFSRLSVNGDEVSANTPASTKFVHLRTLLYVGGYDREKVTLAPGVGVQGGFHGCVSSVEVSGTDISIIGSMVNSANLEDCAASSHSEDVSSICMGQNPCRNGGSCLPQGQNNYNCSCPEGYTGKRCEIETQLCQLLQPCKNNGVCTGTTSSYKCQCLFGYKGTTCEQDVNITTNVNFNGDGYLELTSEATSQLVSTQEVIKIDFSTTSPDGLLLWRGQRPGDSETGQDFLALAIVDGYLEFSYELGSGPAKIRSSRRVADGYKHRAVLRRDNKDGSLVLDDDRQYGESSGSKTSLNTASNLYVGGVPNIQTTTSHQFSHGFTGCVHLLELEGVGVVNFNHSVLSALNVLPCSATDARNIEDNYDDFVNK